MEIDTANMKKSNLGNRSKPPPVRNSYLCAKLRNHLSIERPNLYSAGSESTNRLVARSISGF